MNGNMGMNIPNFGQLTDYSVNRAGEYEGTRQSLYDFQTYDSAGAISTNFFQVPQGQSSKTIQDTNMELAGSLPNPKYFLIQSIELMIFPAELPVQISNTAATDAVLTNFSNDVYEIGKAGNLDLFIGSKSYLQESPLMRFPPKTCLKTEFSAAYQMKQAAAADESGQIVGDYASFFGRPYFIDPWILLTPTQNFKVQITFSAAVAISADARWGVILDGILYKLSQ